MGGKQLGLAAWREKSGNSGAQVVTHPTALCKREGAINTFFMGIISNKEVPLPESWDWELLEELLDAADQGGDSAGGAWGRWRREGGDRAFWDMCVKGRVDPISHVVPIILRILSVLETGSCRKYSRIKGAKLIASHLQ